MIRTHTEYVVQGQPFTLRDADEFRAWTRTWGLRFDDVPTNRAAIFTPGVYARAAGIVTDTPGRRDPASEGLAAALRSQSLYHTHGIIELLVVPHLIAELLGTVDAPAGATLRVTIPQVIHGQWRQGRPLAKAMFPHITAIEVQVSGEAAPRRLTLADLPADEITSPIAALLSFASDATDRIVIEEIQHDRHFDVARYASFTAADFQAAGEELASRGYGPPENNLDDLAQRMLARECVWIGRVASRTLTVRRDGTWSLETHQDTAFAGSSGA